VIARTWVGKGSRRLFERHTGILRPGDRKLLARARALRCPLDPGARKSIVAADDLYSMFSIG